MSRTKRKNQDHAWMRYDKWSEAKFTPDGKSKNYTDTPTVKEQSRSLNRCLDRRLRHEVMTAEDVEDCPTFTTTGKIKALSFIHS